MKFFSTILAFVFAAGFYSCKKEQVSDLANCSVQDPPTWCATVRCTSEGKPVCGCNNITYGSVCEAQCSGVTSYTMGACK
jgi:NAD(P)H-nitrite reductase large subunit